MKIDSSLGVIFWVNGSFDEMMSSFETSVL